MNLIDTHAHLDFPALSENLPEVLQTARDAGITRIVAIGASRGLDSNYRALEIARQHPEMLRCTAGIHPHDASMATPEIIATINNDFAHLPEVVAIGESGLDYHYDYAPKETQHHVFRQFLQMARTHQKPIVVHSRDADQDTMRLIREEQVHSGIIHCFTGSPEFAQQAIQQGFHISFSGIVTFKNGADLLDIAARIPADRLLVETDAPYLAPIPFRGKTNQPAYVRHTAEKIAQARNISLEQLAEIVWQNATRLFNWP